MFSCEIDRISEYTPKKERCFCLFFPLSIKVSYSTSHLICSLFVKDKEIVALGLSSLQLAHGAVAKQKGHLAEAQLQTVARFSQVFAAVWWMRRRLAAGYQRLNKSYSNPD